MGELRSEQPRRRSIRPAAVAAFARNRFAVQPDDRAMRAKRADRPPILVVDDQPEMIQALERLLVSVGYQARSVEAHGLEEARTRLRESTRFAGFLVDWRLRERVTSEPLLEDVRRLYPRPRRTPLYVATVASEEEGVIRRVGRYGARVLRKRPGAEWEAAADELRRSERRTVALLRWLDERARPDRLSPRQVSVALAMIDGARPDGIARALGVDPKYLAELARHASARLRVARLSDLIELCCVIEA